ncbi:MAG TPA: hydroxyacid dehydrogenase [Microbacteriaceae bacterium]
MQPKVFVASSPNRVTDVCSTSARRLLEGAFDMRWNSGPELTSRELASQLGDAEVLLTSWGSPHLDGALLRSLPSLRIVGHAAGSVKGILPQNAFEHLDAVFSAAPRIADSVGEYCLAAAMTLLRRLPRFDARMRAGGWKSDGFRGQELRGRTVGIVGGSSTARAFMRLLRPFNVTVRLFDPYLSDDAASLLRAAKAPLEDVMGSDIVSIHLPATGETEGMITATLVARIPDGGILINSSRGTTVDTNALYCELATGRISAALDVFESEPPALGADIRGAANVLLSPHIAGDTAQGHLALMEFVVRDIMRWLDDGEQGSGFVDPAVWRLSA